jgi:glutamine---fructose-6-phosphate transaminase (isomerizing)
MCGVSGYIGNQEAVEQLIVMISRLEYRGYDSGGITVISKEDNSLQTVKSMGGTNALNSVVQKNLTELSNSNCGIGHNRWATHGAKNLTNAHPHLDYLKKISVVHNGQIENYKTIKGALLQQDVQFYSETDTEVIPNLISYYYRQDGNFLESFKRAISELEGAYAILCVCNDFPETIFAANKGGVLYFGRNQGEVFLSSGKEGLGGFVNDYTELKSGEIAICKKNYTTLLSFQGFVVDRQPSALNIDTDVFDTGDFDNFLIKEISEQPEVVENLIRGRLDIVSKEIKLGGFQEITDKFVSAKDIYLLGIGTSYLACKLGEMYIDTFTKKHVKAMVSTEFKHVCHKLNAKSIVIALSQSGTTTDTIKALELSRQGTTFGIVNVVGSKIDDMTDAGLHMRARTEISVASTKAFTAQVVSLLMIAAKIGKLENLRFEEFEEILFEIKALPILIQQVINKQDTVQTVAEYLNQKELNHLYILGNGFNYPAALEGALKLKEVCYIHAEGMITGEFKHGPLAMINEKSVVIMICPNNSDRDVSLNNCSQIQASGGKVIGVVTAGDRVTKDQFDDTIEIPRCADYIQPILSVVVLQLLTYYLGLEKGVDIDNPKNLAKSVTVS